MPRSHRYAGRISIAILAAAALVHAPTTVAADRQAPRVSTERSHSHAPEWTVRTPETDKTYMYFVGRASGGSSLEAAENDAAADVVRQIVSAIGLEASFDYDRLRSEANLLLTDKLELSGESTIIGLKRIEIFYQKTTTIEGNSVHNSWNAQVLARYPVEAMKSETARLEQLSRTRVATAENLLAEARRLENSGLSEGAWNKLSEALDLTGQVGVVADPATASRLAVVRQRLIDRARGLSFQLHRLTVADMRKPESADPGEDGGQLMVRALETALQNQGFCLERGTEAAAAGTMPVVRLELSEQNGYQIEPGFNLSLWNAAISISAPGGGAVLCGDVYPVKGFGTDTGRAELDAMRKLRSEVFQQFAGRAREFFEYKLAGEDGSETPRAF